MLAEPFLTKRPNGPSLTSKSMPVAVAFAEHFDPDAVAIRGKFPGVVQQLRHQHPQLALVAERDQFRGDVGDGRHHLAARFVVGAGRHRPGQAEVGDLDDAVDQVARPAGG